LLTQARQRLANGEDPEEVLNAVTNLLVNKLMHNPTVRLRDAGANGHEEFIAMARTLFDLD